MHLALVVNILPVFKKGGQELKAHLSIKSTNGDLRRAISIVNNNDLFVSCPFWECGTWCLLRLPMIHQYCLFLLFLYLLLTTIYCFSVLPFRLQR